VVIWGGLATFAILILGYYYLNAQSQPESMQDDVIAHISDTPMVGGHGDQPIPNVEKTHTQISELSEQPMLTFSISDKIRIQLLYRNVNDDQQQDGSEGEVIAADTAGADNDDLGNDDAPSDSAGSNKHGTERPNRDSDGDGDNNRLLEDSDGDGIIDLSDQCPRDRESFNGINDSDGCPDVAPPVDTDSDEIPDSSDNCPDLPNPTQSNMDADAMGDACDPDDDNDGLTDDQERSLRTNPFDPDSDGEGISDPVDACPLAPENYNGFQDTDGCPDLAPADEKDADGVPDSSDNCPNVANPDQEDFDSDGIGDACDPDRDNDTVLDISDACPFEPETFNTLDDSDGCPDVFEPPVPAPLPDISIEDVLLTESNSRTKNFDFTVTRTGETSGASSVDFATADGTATVADADYAANAGTLDFAAGETSKTVTVVVNGDTDVESDETFFVNLSNCLGCNIADGQGLGTIVNDDFPPAPDPCDGLDNNGNKIIDEGEVGTDDNANGLVDEPGDACPLPPPPPAVDPCDGMDNNGNGIIDEAAVGIDDDLDGLIDEEGEACPDLTYKG
jgi:hypothetical protein